MDAVVAEAAKLGYPVNEMAIGGGSAGGCLALLYAYRDTAESPVPVRFVFEAVGPSSFYPEDWDNYGLDKPEAQAEAAGLFGVTLGDEGRGTHGHGLLHSRHYAALQGIGTPR